MVNNACSTAYARSPLVEVLDNTPDASVQEYLLATDIQTDTGDGSALPCLQKIFNSIIASMRSRTTIVFSG